MLRLALVAVSLLAVQVAANASSITIGVPANKDVSIDVGRYRVEASAVGIRVDRGSGQIADETVLIPVQQAVFNPQKMQRFVPKNPGYLQKSPTGFGLIIGATWSGGGGFLDEFCTISRTDFEGYTDVAFSTGCAEEVNTVVRITFK